MPNGFHGGLGPRGHLTEEEKANRPRVSAALRAQGYDFRSLAVAPENTEAITFWSKQGFALSGKEMVWNGSRSAVMERGI